ncbi:hypothetical protein FACS189429_3670 [Bacteroidia bacterium]|nr:hypothetical protein FACS189429_3670 [Bacteroidia bacterium]
MKIRLLLVVLSLSFSCQNYKRPIISEESGQVVENGAVSTVVEDSIYTQIAFNPTDFREINGYKEINFNSENSLFDSYLFPIDSVQFELECSTYNDLANSYDDEINFTIDMDYGTIKFESIDEGDTFFEYHSLKNIDIPNYKAVRINGVDMPYTVFINYKVYEGFKTNGKTYFSNDKKYFISVSNAPDYCLLEIYKIFNTQIINIVNLFSVNYPIDEICWDKELLVKTAIVNNVQYYYQVDWERILQNWNKK